MRAIRILAIALACSPSAMHAASTESEARAAGAAAQGTMAVITEQPAIDANPGYTNSPPETALDGPQSKRDTAATAQQSACASSTSTECEALNTVRADEAYRQSQPSMESDSEVVAARSTGTTPLTSVGLGYSACTPRTQSVGTVTYDLQSCHNYYLRVLDQQCVKVRQVEVTWDCAEGAAGTTVEGTFNYPNGDYYCERTITRYNPSCLTGETMVGSGQFAQCQDAAGNLRPADMETETEIVEEDAVPTIDEWWINPCADMESRVPPGLLLPDGDNTPPSGGSATGRPDKCERVNSICTDETPKTRTINRLDVTRQCWAYRNTFNCVNLDPRSDCNQPRFGSCTYKGERCDDWDAFDPTICTLITKDYSCITSDTRRTETVMDCGTQTYTDNRGSNWDTSYPRNQDFGQVVSFMEAARQSGKYNMGQAQMFAGFDNRCRKKLFGLVNCCNRAGSGADAFNNMSVAMQAGLSGPSPYVFDGLFGTDSPDHVKRGFDAVSGSGGPSIESLLSGDFTVKNVLATLSPSYWTAAVTSFSAASLLSCSEREKELAMKRDARLCDYRGSYCSKKLGFIKTCVERTQTYCCFNSILAKIINREGKAQLGQSMGSAKNPNCGGFTAPELQSLDLATMDFTEFYDSIQAKPLDPGSTTARADPADCYYGDGQCAGSRSTP